MACATTPICSSIWACMAANCCSNNARRSPIWRCTSAHCAPFAFACSRNSSLSARRPAATSSLCSRT
eukprot:5696259-Alexandrium_andersonii.AAC.1